MTYGLFDLLTDLGQAALIGLLFGALWGCASYVLFSFIKGSRS